MPKYWLISDRDRGGTGMGRNVSGLNFFVSHMVAMADMPITARVLTCRIDTLHLASEYP